MAGKNEKRYEVVNLGEKIKDLRMKKGLTQVELARIIGVTPGCISNIENDRISISLKNMIILSRVFDMTLDEFIGEIVPDYEEKALNNQLEREISELSLEDQDKLLRIIRIYKEQS
ncbi:MAG: helix-turn-helix transcriptional regulator [Eubacteriales bacterium]|jgi:transcriptional regulator with XRE-family HTH domain